MYELVLSPKEYKRFVKQAELAMLEKGMSKRELSRKTGYSLSSIYGFFAGKNSRFLAAAISKELGVNK